MNKCIEYNTNKINHIYLVLSLQFGIEPTDLNIFNLLLNKYLIGNEMKNKVSIILTFSQTTTDEQFNHYISQFNNINKFRNMFKNNMVNDNENELQRFLFVGTLSQHNNGMINQEKVENNVYKQRNNLLKQNTTFDLKNVPFYNNNVQLVGQTNLTHLNFAIVNQMKQLYCDTLCQLIITKTSTKPDSQDSQDAQNSNKFSSIGTNPNVHLNLDGDNIEIYKYINNFDVDQLALVYESTHVQRKREL